ncbi:MAG: acyl-ACP--UDP-N-acetylglucosamine O-acyltransferase [Prevotellaceae bacterium]|jgi:UDP-N-acetylglucosamine acyltransferase|nr:acyl-ACP--UDP-N-acetylglucosamine O-acyltransferase [Prevotellaceae bacterium]
MKHPLSSIHPDAIIGENVIIDPFVTVEKNVVIGDGTHLYPNAVVLNGARIGKNCNIMSGAVVAGIPQDLKFKGEETLAIIGDGTTLRECVTVNRGTASRGKTVVGSKCLIMAYSHVAHDCILANNIILGNATQLAGEVEVEDFAIISGGCLVHQFSKIGAHVMIQGGSRVNKDVPPYIIAAREPIVYAGVNAVGLRRRGFAVEQIREIQDIYRTLFLSGLNNTQALETIDNEYSESEVRNNIVNFVRNSQRGILRSNMD